MRWVVPIAGEDKNGWPDLAGHGFLLDVMGDGGKLLVSAAHVLDALNSTDDAPASLLWVPGKSDFIPLNGLPKYLPPAPGGDRWKDPIDLGYVCIDSISTELARRYAFAAPADLIAAAPHEPGYPYAIFGFPGNGVERAHGKPVLRLGNPIIYTGDCLDPSCHSNEITSPATNLAIEFNKKKTFDKDDKPAVPKDPNGLSGTPFLAHCDSKNSVGGHLHIVGFLTHPLGSKKSPTGLVGTRIDCLIAKLQRDRSGLTFGNAKVLREIPKK
jgi:hypothetical protein